MGRGAGLVIQQQRQTRMTSGELDQRIELLSPVEVNNAGSLEQSYSTVATVFGKVISQRGNESFEAARTNARAAIRVKLRYRSDVTTKWRLNWSGQNYNIVFRDPSERRQGWLWLTAEVKDAV